MIQVSAVLAALSDEEFAALLLAAVERAGADAMLDGLPPAEKAALHTALARLQAGETVDWTEVRAKLVAKLA